MPIHDAFARITPYEISFPDAEFARVRFEAISEEAAARQVDLRDPSAFVMLAAAGDALREIRGSDDDPALITEYGFLLYHAFHFSRAGEPLYLMETRALRGLLERETATAEWTPSLADAAGYVQFPQHLVWVRSEPESPPESLDGFFWARSGDAQLGLLLALGMRGDRPGLSVVALTDLPARELGPWSVTPMRDEGADFASSLPGAELEGLYELRSGGEALKLAARVLWRIECGAVGAATSPEASAEGGPRPSALSFRRVG